MAIAKPATALGVSLNCPGCGLRVQVPQGTKGEPATCLLCGADNIRSFKTKQIHRPGVTDFGLSLPMDPEPSEVVAPEPPRPLPPSRTRVKTVLPPESVFPVAQPIDDEEGEEHEEPGSGLGWKIFAGLVLAVGSLVATVLVAHHSADQAGEPAIAQFLPRQPACLGYIRWDKIQSSDGFRRLKEIGQWSEFDETDLLRFLGVPGRRIESVLFAADSAAGSPVAIVTTVDGLQPDEIPAHLKMTPRMSNVGGRTVFTAGEIAYCPLSERTVLIGDRGQLVEILDRKGTAGLSLLQKEFLSKLETIDGFQFEFEPRVLAKRVLHLHGIDLGPLMQALASKVDSTMVRCDLRSNLKCEIVLRKDGLSDGQTVDAPQIQPDLREKLQEGLMVPEGFFDAAAWERTSKEARLAFDIQPNAIVDLLLEESAPAYFWTRILQNPANPRHAAARTQLVQQGARAIPYLARALSQGSPAVRIEVLRALNELGADAEPALGQMLLALDDKNEMVRKTVVATLSSIAPRSLKTRLAVLKSLADAHPAVQQEAEIQLAKLATPTLADAPEIMRLGQSRHPLLWKELCRQIGTIALQARYDNTLEQPFVEFLLRGLTIHEVVRPVASAAFDKLKPFTQAERPWLLTQYRSFAAPEVVREAALLSLIESKLIGVDLHDDLLRTIQSGSSSTQRQLAIRALGQSRTPSAALTVMLAKATHDPVREVGLAAIEALGAFAAHIPDASYVLLEVLESPQPDLAIQACIALGKLGHGAILARPLLQRLAVSESEPLKNAAAEAVSLVGPPKISDAAELGRHFKNADRKSARWCAAKLIDELGPKAGGVWHQLAEEIHSEDPKFRILALSVIRQEESCPMELMAGFVRALEDSDPTVRFQALSTLSTLELQPLKASLQKLLASTREVETQLQILRALAARGEKDPQWTDAVVSFLRDGEPVLRVQAAKALAKVASDDDLLRLKATLTRIVTAKDAKNRTEILEIVKARGGKLSPILSESLTSDDVELQIIALGVLKSMDAGAVEYLADLRKCLQPNAPLEVRLAAVGVAEQMGARAEKVVKDLAVLLKKEDSMVRSAVVKVLTQLGPKVAPAKVELAGVLQVADRQEFESTLPAIQKLGLETKELIEYLLDGFRNRDPEVRTLLVQEVIKFRRPAVYPLTVRVNDPNPGIRIGALLALGQLGSEAASCVPTLQKRLRVETFPAVQQEIVKTLQLITN